MKEIISIKTDYSILESMIKIPCLISYAVENGINSLGIVDNNLGYVAEFVKLCNKNNIKYIIGLEVKYKDTNIYLYAKNEDGYKDLLKINTYLLDNEVEKIYIVSRTPESVNLNKINKRISIINYDELAIYNF